jgi:uncharacterized protein (TIGR03000 family)
MVSRDALQRFAALARLNEAESHPETQAGSHIVKNRYRRFALLAVALTLCILPASHAEEGFFARIKEYYRNRPYPVDMFAPGNYGYNLDDQGRGYFGGGRYTEYYNYGRGGNLSSLANFPGPAPGPQWLYDNRNWIGTQPVRPFAGPVLQQMHTPVPGCARLTIEVPADAVVWLEDKPTQQTGVQRQFVSPQLEAGATYTYTVKARWTEGGKEVEQVQYVPVQAGNIRVVVFPMHIPAPGLLPATLGQAPVIAP